MKTMHVDVHRNREREYELTPLPALAKAYCITSRYSASGVCRFKGRTMVLEYEET